MRPRHSSVASFCLPWVSGAFYVCPFLFQCLQALRERLQPCGIGFYFTPICIPLGCGNRKPRVCVLRECHIEASVLVDMSFVVVVFYKHPPVWIWCCPVDVLYNGLYSLGDFQARVQSSTNDPTLFTCKHTVYHTSSLSSHLSWDLISKYRTLAPSSLRGQQTGDPLQ